MDDHVHHMQDTPAKKLRRLAATCTLQLLAALVLLALLWAPHAQAESETARFAKLFPLAEMHGSSEQGYYLMRLNDCQVIALYFKKSPYSLLPLVFVKATEKEKALQTAQKLLPLLYGEGSDESAIIPFQGQEPSVAIVHPRFFSIEPKYVWRLLQIMEGKSLLRTILYPAYEAKCSSIADVQKCLRFIGWQGTCVKVGNVPNEDGAKAPQYEIIVDVNDPEVENFAVHFLKNTPLSRQICAKLSTIMYGHQKHLNQQLPISIRTNLYKKLQCQAVLAFDNSMELGIIRRGKLHCIGEANSLNLAPGGGRDFPSVKKSSLWPTKEKLDRLSRTTPKPGPSSNSGEIRRFVELYPEAEQREGYFIMQLNGCRVVAPYGINLQSYTLMPSFFVTGPSQKQALETAESIIRKLYEGCPLPLVLPFTEDKNSIAVIYAPLTNWKYLNQTGNLTRAILSLSLNASDFTAPTTSNELVDDKYQIRFSEGQEQFRLLDWQGTCLRVANASPIKVMQSTLQQCEMLIDFEQPELKQVALQLISPANIPNKDLAYLCGTIFELPSTLITSINTNFQGAIKKKLCETLACDDVLAYDPLSDFAIIMRNNRCYSGKASTLRSLSNAPEKKEFVLPKEKEPVEDAPSPEAAPQLQPETNKPLTPAEALKQYLELLTRL